jgi:cytochrome c-type biogenesis protein
MESLLQQFLDSSSYAVLTAFLLGLLTAISPCPLATNITAIGFISKDISDRKRVFFNGLIYTLGRALSYTGIGVLIYFGASKLDITKLFMGWGERVLGPVLIVIGLLMLDVFRLPVLRSGSWREKLERFDFSKWWMVLLLGVLFALTFCPYSGVLYFGMLIPLTIAQPEGLLLPPVFALATGLPVIVFAWMIAFAVGQVGNLYNKIKTFEKWSRRVVAVGMILTGLYYCYVFFM